MTIQQKHLSIPDIQAFIPELLPMARPLKVAIIGGGPGGLATFIALQSVPNVEATIYEKASEVREIGAGISTIAPIHFFVPALITW